MFAIFSILSRETTDLITGGEPVFILYFKILSSFMSPFWRKKSIVVKILKVS